MSDYRVAVYNVFVERGNVAVLHCNIPANVRDFVEILAWWRQEGRERTEIHSGGRYLVTTSGTLAQPAMLGSGLWTSCKLQMIVLVKSVAESSK